MAKDTTTTMKVDNELKRQAELVCADIGLTPSAAYTLFLKAVVRTRSIPFKLEASNSFLPVPKTENFQRIFQWKEQCIMKSSKTPIVFIDDDEQEIFEEFWT